MGTLKKKEKKEDFLGPFMLNYTPASEKRLVISMDFGSTHCGVAYALTEHEEGEKPQVIGKVYRKKFSKEPTCALFDRKTKTLLNFGFEAREEYMKVVDDEEKRENFLYFDGRSIKMRLWDSSFRTDATCETVDGSGELQLSRVVSAILSHLKLEALQMAVKGTEVEIPPEDALWVVTVPSIWQEGDKQFMRKCAHRAGIINDVGSTDLILALEPECAVISAKNAIKEFASGQKLLCMDCGGGTVDICAVKVVTQKVEGSDEEQVRLRQLLEPTGGNWGSTFIDQNFMTFLGILLQDMRLETIREAKPGAIMEVLTEWEALKTGLTHKELHKKLGERTINVSGLLEAMEARALPHDLAELTEAYNLRCQKTRPEFSGVKVRGRKGEETNIVLPMDLILTFFAPVMDKIVEEVTDLVAKPELQDLDYLLMVGGFAESDVLRHEVKRITKKLGIRLVVPKHASQVVQLGAVEYGLNPSIVSTRRARQTIGVKVSMRLRDVENPEDEEVQRNRYYDKVSKETYVRNIFHPYVTKGQEIETAMTVRRDFASQNEQSRKVKFDIYATDAEKVRFVTDPGCVRLAQIIVEIAPGSSPSLECMIQFASTEITAEIKDKKTGRKEQLMLKYNNMGLRDKTGTVSTFVQVPIRELAAWGEGDFDGHFEKMSEML